MPGTVANLFVMTEATLKVGAYGGAEIDAVDVGALEGGAEFSNPREYKDFSPDAWLGDVLTVKLHEETLVKCKMAEPTLNSFAIAFDYPTTAVVGSKFKFGGDDTVSYRTLYFTGKCENGKIYKVILYKCVQKGDGKLAYKKGELSVFDVEFKAYEDTSKPAKQRCGETELVGADTTPPTVALSTPVDGGTVVKETKGIVVWTITETNPLDEGTIVYGNTFNIINITDPATQPLVAGTIVYDSTAKTVTFTPTANWTASDKLQAIVTTGLSDMAGNNLAAIKIEQFSVTV